jgi:hypothetical protein
MFFLLFLIRKKGKLNYSSAKQDNSGRGLEETEHLVLAEQR